MKRNAIKVIGKVGVLLVLGIISGCAYGQSERIAAGRFEVQSGGFGYDNKWKEEARKVCPNGYSVVERGKCERGDSCVRGTIKCE